MIAAEQTRSAHYALRISVLDLSEITGVSTATIKRIEAMKGFPSSAAVIFSAIKTALESAGIEFVGTLDDARGIYIHGNGSKA